MKEWMRVFFAVASTLGGTALIVASFLDARVSDGRFMPTVTDVVSILIGIILMAGGITYFWTRSKFYRG
jgi:hypothetical protein